MDGSTREALQDYVAAANLNCLMLGIDLMPGIDMMPGIDLVPSAD